MLNKRIRRILVIVLMLTLTACSIIAPKSVDVTGIVTFAKDGSPLGGAEIIIGNKTGETALDGTFTVQGVLPGDYSLVVRLGGVTIHKQDVKIASGAETVEISLGSVLSGFVTFESGKPAAGVRVRLLDEVVFTNEAGFYVFSGVPEGEQEVTAIASSIEYPRQVMVTGAHTADIHFIVPDVENIALHKPVQASSYFVVSQSVYPPENAVDGNWSESHSRWLTANEQGPPHWLIIDLGDQHGLHGAALYTGDVPPRNPGNPLRSFRFQYWTGDEWADIPGGVAEDNDSHEVHMTFTDSVITDKVRFYTEEEPQNIGGFTAVRILEVMIFGLPYPD